MSGYPPPPPHPPRPLPTPSDHGFGDGMSTNTVLKDFITAALRADDPAPPPAAGAPPGGVVSLAVRAPPLELALGPNDGGAVSRAIGYAMIPLVRSEVSCHCLLEDPLRS